MQSLQLIQCSVRFNRIRHSLSNHICFTKKSLFKGKVEISLISLNDDTLCPRFLSPQPHLFLFLPHTEPENETLLLLRSFNIYDSLGVNYCVNYSQNNGSYCTKWAHSHLPFGQFFHRLKNSRTGCEPIFRNCLH